MKIKHKLLIVAILLAAFLLAWVMSVRGQGLPKIIGDGITYNAGPYTYYASDSLIIGTFATGQSIDGLLIYSGEKKRISINDTVICRTVHFQIGPGVYFDSTFCFVIPKPLPIIIRDTVIIHDTIPRICPICPVCPTCPACPDTPSTGLKWSDYKGSMTFSQFIALCQSKSITAIVDIDVAPAATIEVKGNLTLEGLPGVTIANQLPGPLFRLYEGNHIFRNFRLLQTDSVKGIGFFSSIAATGQLPFVFHDSIDNVFIDGGYQGYTSSRGGRANNWSTTSIINSTIKTKHVNVMIFSQDGNVKSALFENLNMYSSGSHNFYIHPNVSTIARNVVCHVTGPTAVNWHGFSGGGGQGSGVADSAYYSIWENCVGGAWQIPQPFTRRGAIASDSTVVPVLIKGGNMGLYSIPQPLMKAREVNLTQGPFNGTCNKCTGSFRPMDESVYDSCNFSLQSMQHLGRVTYINTNVDMFYGTATDGRPKIRFEIVLDNSTMKKIAIAPGLDYRIYLKNGSPVPRGEWGFYVDPAKVVVIGKE